MSASHPTIHSQIEYIRQLSAAHKIALPLIIDRPVPDIDILSWISGGPTVPRVYWRSRSGETEFGGFGCAMEITPGELPKLYEILPESDIIAFHARHFESDGTNDKLWEDFSKSICLIPETTILRRGTKIVLRYCIKIESGCDIVSVAERLSSLEAKLAMPQRRDSIDPVFRPIHHLPDKQGWTDSVRTILDAIEAGSVAKTVLARLSLYECDSPVSPGQVLTALAARQNNTYMMFYQPTPDSAFISFTPERLFHRIGNTITIDALSSTTDRGKTDNEDDTLEQDLRTNGKQRHEHDFVIEGIFNSLSRLCAGSPHIEATDVLKLATIQHLRTKITAELKSTDDAALIAALHPTPAVGGTPTAAAIEYIRKLEPFRRGLYAAPMGLLSRDESEFAVGIRSLVMRKNLATVFTGAGIVAGSQPESEWKEIDSKNILAPFIQEVAGDG